MANKIEMSLDDIIKTNKIENSRGGVKKQVNGAGGHRRKEDNKPMQKFHGTANRQIGKTNGLSLRIQASAHTRIGFKGAATQHRNKFDGGKPITFSRAVNGSLEIRNPRREQGTDAIRARKQYNGVNGRSTHIRLATATQAVFGNQRSTFVTNKKQFQGHNPYKWDSKNRQAAKVGRNHAKPKAVTAEELDAEMDAYAAAC